MTATTACIRGCGIRNRHLDDCDGKTPSERVCRGCLPRHAEYGLLCWPCHHRLRDMLIKAAAIDGWLSGNMTMGDGAARVRQDYERSHTDDGAPTPIKIAVLDAQQQLRDHWAEWVDWLCERERLHGPDRHTVEADTTYLLTWIDRIERWETIGDLWEQTAWLNSCAHALAPWRPEVKRVPTIACPECEETNLVIYGGDSHVTCRSCHAVILDSQIGLWERYANDQRESKTTT